MSHWAYLSLQGISPWRVQMTALYMNVICISTMMVTIYLNGQTNRLIVGLISIAVMMLGSEVLTRPYRWSFLAFPPTQVVKAKVPQAHMDMMMGSRLSLCTARSAVQHLDPHERIDLRNKCQDRLLNPPATQPSRAGPLWPRGLLRPGYQCLDEIELSVLSSALNERCALLGPEAAGNPLDSQQAEPIDIEVKEEDSDDRKE
jgi:hypothetical protein